VSEPRIHRAIEKNHVMIQYSISTRKKKMVSDGFFYLFDLRIQKKICEKEEKKAKQIRP
jgi:hypothetical protein